MVRPQSWEYHTLEDYVSALEKYCDWVEEAGSIGKAPFKDFKYRIAGSSGESNEV
jgi:hypothetical protein